ncbi:hypothetical protein [Entomobacter blattae]|uniref:Uncharacterized protein n=1 Tax=Entomobacter blattae TaxID=2762277 RepID=A0A7H1NPQ6_9PROT|nr:hypothetical protein [Entomobacter blattae]QNT77766.1 hypothetical protein JGUZn3_05190 [Entomobacter blattae]
MGSILLVMASPVWARAEQAPADASVYDLSPLPVSEGTIAQFIPTPQGGIDGFLLTNGIQVILPPDMGLQVSTITHVGDKVKIQGLRGETLPILRGFSVTDTHKRTIRETGLPKTYTPHHGTGPYLVTQGVIKQPLYNQQGMLCGAILSNQSIIWVSPIKALEYSAMFRKGKTLYARGSGSATTLGEAIQAQEIGPSMKQTVQTNLHGSVKRGAAAGMPDYDLIPGSDFYSGE